MTDLTALADLLDRRATTCDLCGHDLVAGHWLKWCSNRLCKRKATPK